MKKYLLFVSMFSLLVACDVNSENPIDDESEEETEVTETVIPLEQDEDIQNAIFDKYFSHLPDFPTQTGEVLVGGTDEEYSISAVGLPVRGGEYFADDNLTHYNYDFDADLIEIAYLVFEGAIIQGEPLDEDIYVHWIYDFNEDELSDLVVEDADGQAVDKFDFSDEDWKDFSEGHKDFVLDIATI